MVANRYELAGAYFEWLNRPGLHDNAIAATLTFKPSLCGKPLTVSAAELAVGHYLRRLDAIAFGKGAIRRGKKLGAIAIREGGPEWWDKHIHYHLQLQVPERWTKADWKLVAAREWNRVRWASDSQNRFGDVYDQNWLAYMLKPRDKPTFTDAVDVGNTRIN